MQILFHVYRYNDSFDWKPRYDAFKVPYVKGMTVLDVVMYIQKNLDATIGYRYECRQGICGTCGIMLNGMPVLSCSTQVNPAKKRQVLEPLSHFPVEKDLSVNIKPVLERFMRVKPFLEKVKKIKITKEMADKSKPFRKCIECGCCIAASDYDENTLDPMSLVKLARYVTDPRDGEDRKKIAREHGVNMYTQKEGKKLAAVCPREIPIDQAIKILKK